MSEGTDAKARPVEMGALFSIAIKAIRDVGFPIVVALFFLLQLNPKMDQVLASLNKLVVIMEAKR